MNGLRNNHALYQMVSNLKLWLLGAIPFFFAIGLWVFLTEGGYVRPYFLPSIPSILKATLYMFSENNYIFDILISCYRIVAGFILAAIVAIPLGLFMGYNKKVAHLAEPLIDFVRYIPMAAVIPLFILWFGIGNLGKIAIICLGTFFQLVLMIADAAASVRKEFYDVSYTLGASRWQVIRTVLVPASLPGTFDSLRINFGLAWTILIFAEILGATSGMGFVIVRSQRYLQIPDIYVGVFIIGFLGIITDFLFKFSYKLLFRWSEKTK